jgi:large subunit ribosomal protein L23
MIKQVVVTEKTARLSESNCYTFLVDSSATKIDIKRFVESYYNVSVKRVNVLKSMSKSVRRGRVVGATLERRKAYVFTKEKIQALEEAS